MRKTERTEKIMICVAGLSILVLFYMAGMNIRGLKKQNYELSKELKVVKNEITTLQEQQRNSEDAFRLMSGTKIFNAGAVSGISKSELGAFKIESPYPSVMYQVLNNDGNVVAQAMKEGNAKVNTITLEKLPEDMTQIRILGFDETGTQCIYKIYDFGFVD